MLSRFTALMLALFMGVPLCWCCSVALPAAAASESDACSACRYLEAEEGAPSAPMGGSHEERRCCAKFNVRTLSPDLAAAPRLVLVDLQTWVWADDEITPPSWEELRTPLAVHAPPDPLRGPPLYRQHCALLL